jgi:hypothetical protein
MQSDANSGRHPVQWTDRPPAGSFLTGRTAMTTEIFALTAQIHRWLDLHVARYLAAQAAKLSH